MALAVAGILSTFVPQLPHISSAPTVSTLSATTATTDDATPPHPRLIVPRANRTRPSPVPKATRTATPVRRTHPHRTARLHAAPVDYSSAYAWAHSTAGIKVSNCESGDRRSWTRYNGDPHMNTGYYKGKWQDGPHEWSAYGGLEFASRPDLATEAEQDVVNFRLWKARGWQPWSCSSIMGVR